MVSQKQPKTGPEQKQVRAASKEDQAVGSPSNKKEASEASLFRNARMCKGRGSGS